MIIRNLDLQKRPAVVGIIDSFYEPGVIQELMKNGVEIFELRVDRFEKPFNDIKQYLETLKNYCDCPKIGTIRETESNVTDRELMFEQILPYCDLIDIEFGSPISKEVEKLVHGKSKLLIVSEHDFEKTPDTKNLQNLVYKSIEQGADIVKIAVTAQSKEDVIRLLEFTSECKHPVVTISMGVYGKISRIAAPLYGSLFTYGFIKDSVVPNQVSAAELARQLEIYYPR